MPYNYFIVYPAYVVMYHLPLDAIIGMYQAINPNVNGLLNCLLVFNLPFTFFKGMLDAVICFANLQAAFAHSAWPQQRWQKRNRLIAADWAAIIGHFYPF